MIETRWTTERIALLKDRIRAGFSCGQIACELGVSRNAVIGKTNRLGLARFKNTTPGESKQSGFRQNARPRTMARQTNLRGLWAKPQVVYAELSGESAKACTLLELQQWHCRWPMGDPTSEHFGFCGNRPVAGLPYCPAHAQVAYRPSSREAVDNRPRYRPSSA
jgi:GcrA cell cycle regulator